MSVVLCIQCMAVCQDALLLEQELAFCSLPCCQLQLHDLKLAINKFEFQVLDYQQSLILRHGDAEHVLGPVNGDHVLPHIPAATVGDHFAPAAPVSNHFPPVGNHLAPAVPFGNRFAPIGNRLAPAVPLGGQEKRILRNSYTIEQKQKIITELVGSNSVRAKCCTLSITNGVPYSTMMKWYAERGIITSLTKYKEKRKQRLGHPGNLRDVDFEADVLEHVRYEREHEWYVSTSTILQHMQDNWPVFMDWWFNDQGYKMDSLRCKVLNVVHKNGMSYRAISVH